MESSSKEERDGKDNPEENDPIGWISAKKKKNRAARAARTLK